MSGYVSRQSSYSPTENIDELTQLQLASKCGSIEQVRYLIDSGVDLDVGPNPALHLALRKKFTAIALLLLQAGAEFEVKDQYGDYPIHIASRNGLLEVVHTLCALGCSVEVPTISGLYPLHLAAKYGHINVVRCLCTAGCNIDVRNTDNIRADITALKYSHNNIAELLDKLRATGNRDFYARQLVPTSKPALRLSLRLFGNCGVGKTSFTKSLTAGLFSALFRRSSSLQSNKSRPSSPINVQIEMDVTSRQNSLTFESTASNYQSTNGVNVQNVDISNIGELTIWEFSGQESYFTIYHHFIWPSPYNLTAVLFNLDDSPSTQIQQICFWINFLMARQPADLPTSEYGKILLVATHVDTTRAAKTQQGEWISPDAQKTLETVTKLLPHVPYILPYVVIMDCNVPASFSFKQIKSILSNIKQDYIQGDYSFNVGIKKGSYDLLTPCMQKQTIGTWTGLLESTLTWLTNVQKEYEHFPVITKDNFAELLRNQVNMLASDEHIEELLRQLHIMGEIFCEQDLIVMSVSWLGTQLLGELLSAQFLNHARVTGVYTADDFQSSYNQCDALGVLELLRSLDLCISCEVEGEIEYEFPVYNQTETLTGLWDSGDPRYRVTGANYGGVRLYTPPDTYHLLTSIFPYIQIELRRATLENFSNNDNDTDLYQWHHGSKLCTITLETLITLGEDTNGAEYVEVKIRGPRQTSQYCFYFFHRVLETVHQAICKICPGLIIEQHVLSPQQLRLHYPEPFSYAPQDMMTVMLEAESTIDVTLFNNDTEKYESIVQLLLFDDIELATNIIWGCALKVCDLYAPVKLKICGLLDDPEPHGKDWCLLALRLGLNQEKIAALDSQHTSHTMRLLTISDCTIGALVTNLNELERNDVVDVILRSSPLLKIIEQIQV